jgi:hypothetical protein
MNVIDRYQKNVEMAAVLGRSQDVSTVFVWQPIPTYKYDDVQFHLFREEGYRPYTQTAGYGYVTMEASAAKLPSDVHFLWLAGLQHDLREPLYVDKVHYTAQFSKTIAESIGAELIRRGLLKKSVANANRAVGNPDP